MNEKTKKRGLAARMSRKAEERRKKLEKEEHLYSKRIVLFCIAFIVAYTALSMWLNYRLSIELNPTLTTCVYTFFGGELGLCAFTRFIGALEKKNDLEREKEKHPETGKPFAVTQEDFSAKADS